MIGRWGGCRVVWRNQLLHLLNFLLFFCYWWAFPRVLFLQTSFAKDLSPLWCRLRKVDSIGSHMLRWSINEPFLSSQDCWHRIASKQQSSCESKPIWGTYERWDDFSSSPIAGLRDSMCLLRRSTCRLRTTMWWMSISSARQWVSWWTKFCRTKNHLSRKLLALLVPFWNSSLDSKRFIKYLYYYVSSRSWIFFAFCFNCL